MFKILSLTQLDDYLIVDDRQLVFELARESTWPDLTDATVSLRFAAVIAGAFTHVLTVDAVVIDDSTVHAELTAANTNTLYTASGAAAAFSATLHLQLVATLLDESTATLARGLANVAPSLPLISSTGDRLTDQQGNLLTDQLGNVLTT